MALWDIAVTKELGAVVIEVNLKSQGVNMHQVLNGPMLYALVRHAPKLAIRG